MSQDCKRFEDSLLELAYGELEESAADELRMHATQCHKCRDELENILLTRKLAAQLPIAEPQGDLDSIILDAAAKQADQNTIDARTEEREPVQSSRDPRPEIVDKPSVLEWLRSLLLRPAFATAALVTLIFVFTFFLTEKGMSPDEHEQEALQAPAPVSSLDEAPIEEPRDESPAKEEAEAEKIEQELAMSDAPKVKDQLVQVEEGVERVREKSKSSHSVESKSSRRSAGMEGNFADLTKPPAAPKPSASKTIETTGELSDDLDGVLGGSFAAPPPSGDVASSAGGGGGRSAEDLRNIDQEAAPAAQPMFEEEIQASEPDSVPQTASSEPQSQTVTDFDIGIAAYSRGDCNTAVASFSRVVEQSSIYASNRAYAMHHIAKCEKRRGKFTSAESWYDKLLILYPSYNGRPEALFESAKCLVRMGKIDRARKRLRELTDVPAWTDRAKKELERLSE